MDAAGLQKLFAPFAEVATKGMFGGRGISVDGLMFAVQAGERIYLKTDATSAPRFKAAGSEAFVFRSPMGPKETSYWLMPQETEGSVEAFKTWCGLALEAARRAALAKAEKAHGKRAEAGKSQGRAKTAPAQAGRSKKAVARPSKSSPK